MRNNVLLLFWELVVLTYIGLGRQRLEDSCLDYRFHLVFL